ncbi:hypothetical protein [Methylomonas sp. AM2-LC]|uniref:hypothetical protein n=1 Tax=Methylomonas sp. AM2-LC TaxID=3153301 RepID=UPI0032663EC8
MSTNNTHAIKKGQIFQRKLPGGQFLIVGLCFFSKHSFVPNENYSYIALFNDTQNASVSGFELSKKKPEDYSISDVNCLLKQQIWHATNFEYTGCVRFIPAFEEENGFIVFGASVHPFLETQNDEAWFSVENGLIDELPSLVKTQGSSASCILRMPVWPSINGKKYALFSGAVWTGNYAIASVVQIVPGSAQVPGGFSWKTCKASR